MRVFVPGSLAEVRTWFEQGGVPAGTVVHAVAESLREQAGDADEEELEYLATATAQEAAGSRGGRPVTIAADIPPDGLDQTAGRPTEFVARVGIPVPSWAALFVDDLQWYAVQELPHLGG